MRETLAIRRPPRLELNRHGVFVLRLVIPAAHRDASGRPKDIHVSPRTRDPVQAQVLALQLNTRIEQFRLHSPTEDPRILLFQHQATHSGRPGVPDPSHQGPGVAGMHGSGPFRGQAGTGWQQEPLPSNAQPPSGTEIGAAIEARPLTRGARQQPEKHRRRKAACTERAGAVSSGARHLGIEASRHRGRQGLGRGSFAPDAHRFR